MLGGIHSAVPDAAYDELAAALRSGAEPPAIVAKTVHLIRATSKSPASSDLVGGQCSTLVLPADTALVPEVEYHTAHATTGLRRAAPSPESCTRPNIDPVRRRKAFRETQKPLYSAASADGPGWIRTIDRRVMSPLL